MQDEDKTLSPEGESVSFTPPNQFGRRLFGLTRRPLWTPMMIGANFAVFAGMWLQGAGFLAPGDDELLLRWGANFGPYTTSGEWWRLVACAFIHAGIVHIGMNMWALWVIGRIAERMYGRSGFLAIYFITAVMASLTSTLWHPGGLSVGASGAVFGVYGAFLAFAIRQRRSIPRRALGQLMKGALITLGLNAAIGVGLPFIDMAAHGGGFVAGLLCGFALARPLTKREIAGRWRRSLAAAAYGAALAAASAYVMWKPFRGLDADLRAMDDKADAIMALQGIRDERQAELALLVLRAQARLEAGKLDEAEKLIDRLAKIEPRYPGTHLMRGFIEFERGNDEQAEAAWREAAELAGDARGRAGALENLGLIWLRRGEFQKALDHTTEVNRIEQGMEWNSLIRAIAADQLGEGVIARAAMEVWTEAEKDKATMAIEGYLPKEFRDYLKGLPKGEDGE